MARYLGLQQLVGLEAGAQLHDGAHELQHANVLAHVVNIAGVHNQCAGDVAAALNNFLADAMHGGKHRSVARLAADGSAALARRPGAHVASQELECLTE